jgi:DNA-binding IclR family transcriptional regulator
VLTAIAQHPGGVTREQLTVLTGYKRSTRDTYIQRLGERRHVGMDGDRVVATQAGVDALGASFEPLPTGDALRLHWLQRLPEGERRVLEVVVQAYPKAVEREVISQATDYARSSRDTYLQRLGARRLIVTERGQVRASEELF